MENLTLKQTAGIYYWGCYLIKLALLLGREDILDEVLEIMMNSPGFDKELVLSTLDIVKLNHKNTVTVMASPWGDEFLESGWDHKICYN